MTETNFDQDLAIALNRGLEETQRETFRGLWERNPHYRGHPDGAEVLVGLANVLGAAPAPTGGFGTVTLARTSPGGLDDSGAALFSAVAARMTGESEGRGFYAALAEETGNRDLLTLSDAPALSEVEVYRDHSGVDQDSLDMDRQARRLMDEHAISYMDAASLAAHDIDIAAADADDGSHELPWRDLRPLSTPASPWDADAYERDRRRAEHAGMGELTRDQWQAYSEDGRDIVGEHYVDGRERNLTQLRVRRSDHLTRAKQAEAHRRRDAINKELDRRATARLSRQG